MVTSDPVSPIRPVGSDVNLICMVELSPSVAMLDTLVTVNTVWTGPNEFTVPGDTARPLSGSTTTYTSTAIVSSFKRDQSGVYTCTATVSSTSSFLNMSDSQSEIARVTTGNLI